MPKACRPPGLKKRKKKSERNASLVGRSALAAFSLEKYACLFGEERTRYILRQNYGVGIVDENIFDAFAFFTKGVVVGACVGVIVAAGGIKTQHLDLIYLFKRFEGVVDGGQRHAGKFA